MSEGHLYCEAFTVYFLILRKLKRIFTATLTRSEDNPSKEVFSSQFKALSNHFNDEYIFLEVVGP